jgi:hypothetical protein
MSEQKKIMPGMPPAPPCPKPLLPMGNGDPYDVTIDDIVENAGAKVPITYASLRETAISLLRKAITSIDPGAKLPDLPKMVSNAVRTAMCPEYNGSSGSYYPAAHIDKCSMVTIIANDPDLLWSGSKSSHDYAAYCIVAALEDKLVNDIVDSVIRRAFSEQPPL